jgi:hypothetical protein
MYEYDGKEYSQTEEIECAAQLCESVTFGRGEI